MEELLKYINSEPSSYDLHSLEEYLSSGKCANNLDTYLKTKYKEFQEEDIEKILIFIRRLPHLNNSHSWQIAVRSFCESIFESLATILLYITEQDYPFLPISDKVCNVCRAVILLPITTTLSDEERKRLLEIVKRQATYYIMPNELAYPIALTRLNELGITTEELKELEKTKKWQLENEKKYAPKNRT